MALADILAAIRHETEEEIVRIGSAAKDEIAAIEADADAAAMAAQGQASHANDHVAKASEDRIRNRAQLGANRRLREAEEQVFHKALERVRARLDDLVATDRYRLVMGSLVAESREVLPSAMILRVAQADVDLAKSVVEAGQFADCIVEATLEDGRGIELSTNDGRLVRNTLEVRVARAEPHLRRLLAREVPEIGIVK